MSTGVLVWLDGITVPSGISGSELGPGEIEM